LFGLGVMLLIVKLLMLIAWYAAVPLVLVGLILLLIGWGLR